MKNKKIRNFQIFSVIFTFILGILLHFLYEWTGNNKFIGSFSAINESVWEHLKLIFFPMLITTIIGFFYIGKEKTNYLISKTIGIIVAITFTVVFFYTYSGILGKNVAVIDIGTFFVATILGEITSYKLIINKTKFSNNILALIILAILLVCFILFTYITPRIGIFEEHNI